MSATHHEIRTLAYTIWEEYKETVAEPLTRNADSNWLWAEKMLNSGVPLHRLVIMVKAESRSLRSILSLWKMRH